MKIDTGIEERLSRLETRVSDLEFNLHTSVEELKKTKKPKEYRCKICNAAGYSYMTCSMPYCPDGR